MSKRRVHANGSSNRGGGIATANNTKNIYHDDDDEEDDDQGWVHGGKYVPPIIASRPRSKTQSNSDSSTTTVIDKQDAAPLSVSLCTPVPIHQQQQQQQQPGALVAIHQGNDRSNSSSRTPLTIQLQRLLRPTAATPRLARPTTTMATHAIPSTTASTTDFAANTPREHQNQQQLQQQATAASTSTTLFETFLRQCGVTPHLSHVIGNFLYQLVALLLPILDFLFDATLSVWNSTFVTILPNFLCDLIESICEMTVDFSFVVWKILRFALPYVVWMIQTCVALSLAVGGTILWLLSIVLRGRKRAQQSGVGNIQSSAMKSLKESMRNSPFRKGSGESGDGGRGRLPFSGFTNRYRIPTPRRDGIHSMLASSIATSTTMTEIGNNNHAGPVVVVPPPSSLKSSTPTIASAMRSSNTRSSNLKRAAATTSHDPKANDQSVSRCTTTANTTANTVRTPSTSTTRRVLFFETEAGEVLTDVTTFDKNMPASARKDRDCHHQSCESPDDRNEGELSTRENGVRTSTLDDRQSRVQGSTVGLANPALDTTLPSQTVKKSTGELSSQPTAITSLTHGQGKQPQQSSNSIVHRRDGTEAGDTKEQQYTIIPLSQRYARMKLSQQQQRLREQQRGQMPSIPDATAAATNNNPSRKRRGELLGAASRLGRQRRARLMSATAGTSFFDRNRTPSKRRREDDDFMARTNDLIWRALNHDGKENNQVRQDQEGGTTAKRGKFNSNSGDEVVVSSTPSKPPTDSSSTLLAQITTPPTSPEPSKFNWANSVMATPGLKKTSNGGRGESDKNRGSTATTPFKPSLPLAFDDCKNDDDDDHMRKKDGATRISFGPTNTAIAEVNVTGASFSSSASEREGTSESKNLFGNSSGFASATKTTESQQVNSAASSTAFAFGQSAASSVGGQNDDIASSSSTSAFSTGVTSVAATPAPLFAFENASQSTAPAISQPASTLPAFGNSGVSSDVESLNPTGTNTSAPFAFVGSSQPASNEPATTLQPASFAVTFGNTAVPPSAGALSFGNGATSTPSASGAALAFGNLSQSSAPSSPFTFGPASIAGDSAPVAAAFPAQSSSSFTFGAPSSGGVPDFSAAATNRFRLGGGVSSSGGGGASARRRAAKASGRR